MAQADERQLLSGEHCSVDGTLIQAWAGHKSFVPKDRQDGDDSDGGYFRNPRHSNETHESSSQVAIDLLGVSIQQRDGLVIRPFLN
ncbi:hypothetical protein B9Z47_09500 [Limnohabitans sp. 2KL-1]|nr:hypothetical protein B9Z47_09500 [Limnohabitans sp. 2KL-1]